MRRYLEECSTVLNWEFKSTEMRNVKARVIAAKGWIRSVYKTGLLGLDVEVSRE